MFEYVRALCASVDAILALNSMSCPDVEPYTLPLIAVLQDTHAWHVRTEMIATSLACCFVLPDFQTGTLLMAAA